MDFYDVKVRQQERAFFRKLKTGSRFLTGTGRENTIVEIRQTTIYFRTTQSKKPIAISRRKLREAIRYLYIQRTTTRKELESFSKFSSALLGLLRLVFAEIARVGRTLRGLFRLTLRGVRFWFSGMDRAPDDMRLLRNNGARTVLMSYYHLRDDKTGKWREHAIRNQMLVFLDSGEFTRYKYAQKGKEPRPIALEEYADFIEANRDVLFAWMNLDVVGDPASSRSNADYLKARGLTPIEVWHVGSPWEELERLVRMDLPVIAIGGSALLGKNVRRQYYEEIFERFPNQAFHLLGGSSPFIVEFPWFSTDSSAWLIGRRFRKIVTPFRQMKGPEGWGGQECLLFNIQELAAMEFRYSNTYQAQLLLPMG